MNLCQDIPGIFGGPACQSDVTKGMATACPRKQNGNTLVAPLARVFSRLATTRSWWSNTAGTSTIHGSAHGRRAASCQTSGAFTTCMATFGSGARMGITHIRKARPPIQLGRTTATFGCRGAGRGWRILGSGPVGIAPAGLQAFGIATTVFEWYVRVGPPGRWWCCSSTGSGLGDGCARVLPGGSWINDPDNLFSSYRNNNHPENRNNNIGSRVVCGRWSARKVLALKARTMGATRRGRATCTASAKNHLNRPPHAPAEPGKRNGAGRGR